MYYSTNSISFTRANLQVDLRERIEGGRLGRQLHSRVRPRISRDVIVMFVLCVCSPVIIVLTGTQRLAALLGEVGSQLGHLRARRRVVPCDLELRLRLERLRVRVAAQ